jgi:hypothetical protein
MNLPSHRLPWGGSSAKITHVQYGEPSSRTQTLIFPFRHRPRCRTQTAACLGSTRCSRQSILESTG